MYVGSSPGSQQCTNTRLLFHTRAFSYVKKKTTKKPASVLLERACITCVGGKGPAPLMGVGTLQDNHFCYPSLHLTLPTATPSP